MLRTSTAFWASVGFAVSIAACSGGGVMGVASPGGAALEGKGIGVRFEPQAGHTRTISALGTSADGQLVVTGGSDGLACVWETDAGRIVRRIRTGGDLYSVAISPDHTLLAVGTKEGDEGVFDIATGQKTWWSKVHPSAIWAIAFAGTGVLSVGQDGALEMRNLADGKSVRRFAHKGITVNGARFQRDGTVAVVSIGEGRLQTWSTADGSITAEYRADGDIDGVDVSSTGALIGASGEGKTHWLFTMGVSDPIREFHGENECWGAAFSEDEASLAIGCDDGTLDIFDVKTGARRRITEWKDGDVEAIRGVAFGRGGRRVLASRESALLTWDVVTGHLLDVTPAPSSMRNLVAGGDRVLVAGEKGLDYWRLDELRMVAHITASPLVVASTLAGPIALATTTTGVTLLTETPEGGLLQQPLELPSYDADAAAISGDGRSAAVAVHGALLVVDLRSRKAGVSIPVDGKVVSIAIGQTGDRAIVGTKEGGVALVDLRAGTSQQAALSSSASNPVVVAAAPDSNAFYAAGTGPSEGTVTVFDSADVRTRRALELGHDGVLSIFATSHGLSVVDAHHHLVNIDPKDGHVLQTTALPESASVVVLASNERIAVLDEASAAAWLVENSRTGKVIHFREEDRKWAAWSDDGYFDASRDGGSLIAAVRGDRAFFVDQVAVVANRPDMLLGQLGFGASPLRDRFARRYLDRLARSGLSDGQFNLTAAPEVAIGAVDLEPAKGERVAHLVANAEAHGAALARLQVYVNGVPLYGSAGKAIAGQKVAIDERVALLPGKNQIEVSVTDALGIDSLRAARLLDTAASKTPPRLFFVGFGVSQYQDSHINLQYANKDAVDLGQLMQSLRYAFSDVRVKVLTDAAATTRAVTEARAFLAEANVDDVAVAFFAGHGAYGPRTGKYFFITHDTVVKDFEKTAAPFSEIEALIESTPARKRLVLLDTCASGEQGDATHSDGNRFIEEDVFRRTGAVVFSSSRGDEVSFEDEAVHHGIFTSMLLQGWNGAADTDADLAVSIPELVSFVSRGVAEHTKDKQHPTVDRDNPLAALTFPLAGARGR